MATVQITIPDAALDRVLDAFDGSYNGRLDDEGVELFTKAQWAKLWAARYVKDILVGYEAKTAAAIARDAARANAEAVDIT